MLNKQDNRQQQPKKKNSKNLERCACQALFLKLCYLSVALQHLITFREVKINLFLYKNLYYFAVLALK